MKANSQPGAILTRTPQCSGFSGETKPWMSLVRHCQSAVHDRSSWVALYCERVAKLSPEDDFDRARQASGLLLQTISQNPDSPDIEALVLQIYSALGAVYRQSENFYLAAQCYRQGLELQPFNPQLEAQWQACVSQQQALEERLSSNHPQMPQGVYLSTQHWWRISGREGAGTVFRPMGGTPEGEDVLPRCQPLKHKERSIPACDGIDCHRCLTQIGAQFQLTPIAPGMSVYGKGEAMTVTPPDTFVATIKGGKAWVMPQETWWKSCEAIAILTPDNHLLADVSREYPGCLPNCDRYDGRQHRIFHQESLPPLEAISGTVAVLAGLSPNVYFHWMVDILPRWELLRQSGIDWDEIDWFYINACPHPFGRETLKRLGVPESKILECDRHPYIQADRLVVPSFPGYLGWLPDWGLRFLRQTFLPKQLTLSLLPERIYISRASARYRHVLNEADVVALIAEFGFVSITLESLSLDEQIALFAHAKVIVAPHGSGLTNLIFCQPKTQVIELVDPNYLRYYFRVISQSLELEHYLLEGEAFTDECWQTWLYPNPLIHDLFIDIEKLRTMLISLNLDSPTPGNHLNHTGVPLLPNMTSSQTFAKQYSKQAETLFERKQFDEAIAACQEALKIDPNCAPACKILGNILLSQRKLETAEHWYQKAIQIQPDYAEAYANLGSLFAYQKQWQEAQSYYQNAIKLKPDLTIAHENLAKVWEKLGNEGAAVESLYRAYELNSDRIKSEQYLNLGNRLVQQERLTEAIVCYRRALAKKPDLFGAYQNLAEALTRQGQFQEANQYYRQAVHLGLTNSRSPIAASAPELSSSEFFSQMLQAHTDVYQAYQNLNQAYQTLGFALQHQAKLQREAQHHQHTIQSLFVSLQSMLGCTSGTLFSDSAIPAREGDVLLPSSPKPSTASLLQQAQTQCDGGNFQEAITLCQQAVLAQPDAMAYEIWGTALAGLGKRAEAIQQYRSALAIDNNRLEVYFKLAELYITQQQWQSAIEVYRSAITNHPQVVEVHESLGDLYVQFGELEDAIECYQTAIDLEPQTWQIYHKLGDILQTQGKLHEAMAMYRQATQLVILKV